MKSLTLAAIFIMALTAAKSAVAESDIEWRQIREEQTKIVFFAPGLEGGNKRFYQGELNEKHTVTKGRWAGPSGRFPNAEILFYELAPNYRLRAGRYVLKQFAEYLEFNKGQKVIYGEEMNSRNAVGRVIYGRLTSDLFNCVQFAQLWREFGRRQRIIVGGYCVDAGDKLSDHTIKAVIGGIGIKGVGVPAASGARPARTTTGTGRRKTLPDGRQKDFRKKPADAVPRTVAEPEDTRAKCKDVGGYEAYMKNTGKICRLD